MQTKKKRKKRSKKLLLRGKLSRRQAEAPNQGTERITFTKRSVDAFAHPPTGKRRIYRDTRTPHLCLRITPTAKTFYWEKTVLGRQRRVTIGRFPAINVEQARTVAADIAADYVKGTDVQQNRRTRREEATFGDLWKDYRENRPRRKRWQKKQGVYSRTLDQQWERVLKIWENKQLSEVTYEIVSRKIKAMGKRAPIYANRIQRHGQAMVNYAKRSRDWRWEGENPFEFPYEEENGARKERLEPEDMPAFIKGLDACSESMKLLFQCALFTGRRIGEVKKMCWENLTLDPKKGKWEIPETKTGEKQEAILPPQLVQLLKQHPGKAEKGWVFPSRSKSGRVEEIKKAWETVREVSGLHHLQARDLRRTTASWAQDNNVPIAFMQTQLGHSSYATTAEHYTSILEDAVRTAMETTVASMIQAAAK